MTCPHGQEHPAACIDCIEGTPPPSKPKRRPTEITMRAKFDGPCAADDRHRIMEGQTIGLTDVGWCCHQCIEGAL